MYRYSQREPADDDAAWEDSQGFTRGNRQLPPGPPRQTGRGWGDFNGPTPPPRPLPRASTARRRSHLAREIIETLVLTVVIFVAIRFSVQTFHVIGDSMQPGLQSSEYVMVNRLAYLFSGPSRGDVIVFHYPLDPTQDFIKRVIGLPGDTLVITPTQVSINGDTLREPYISAPANGVSLHVTLKAGEYFVMGDNRPASNDSREWGTVPKDYIIGKATVVIWPLNNWEVIPTYSNVFASVPAPSS